MRSAGPQVLLRLAEDDVWAQMALAYPYQAAVGDTLLAIGQGESWYVIGVIRGTGTSTLTVPGDSRIQRRAAPSSCRPVMDCGCAARS